MYSIKCGMKVCCIIIFLKEKVYGENELINNIENDEIKIDIIFKFFFVDFVYK